MFSLSNDCGRNSIKLLSKRQRFCTILERKDPLDIPARLKELDLVIAGNYTAKSAFDLALYDIAAKAANQPLYQFLGGQQNQLNQI